MKKNVIIVSLVILLILGWTEYYFYSTQGMNITLTLKHIYREYRKFHINVPDNVKSETQTQYTIADPKTGEVPEGFYDTKLADGYTYNNPQPIQDDWIVKPAGDWYPATVDERKLSDSWVVPKYKEIYSETYDNPWAISGINYKLITISGESFPKSTEEFITWLAQYNDLDYVFVVDGRRGITEGRYKRILLTEGGIQDAIDLEKKLSSLGVMSVYYADGAILPQVVDTPLEKKANTKRLNTIIE